MKILVTSQKESNKSTTNLNNKWLSLLITAISLYLDYQYSSARSPRFVLIINYWTPSKVFDRFSPKLIIPSEESKQSFSQRAHILTKVLRELILVSNFHMILSVTKSLIHSESKQHTKLSLCSPEEYYLLHKKMLII